MVTILDGRKIGKVILEDLAKEIKSRDLDLRLAVVSVGQNLVSEKYQQQKKTACEKIGVGFKRYGFPGKIEQAELEREIPCLSITPDVWSLSRQLARKCRQAGVTVPASDLVVAACAIHHQATIEHCDIHFDAILSIAGKGA